MEAWGLWIERNKLGLGSLMRVLPMIVCAHVCVRQLMLSQMAVAWSRSWWDFFFGNFRLDFCSLPVSFSFFHSWFALTREVFWQISWSLYEPKPFVGMLICTQQECFLTFGEYDTKAGAPLWYPSASFVMVCCDTFCLYHKIAAPHCRFGYCTWPYWD